MNKTIAIVGGCATFISLAVLIMVGFVGGMTAVLESLFDTVVGGVSGTLAQTYPLGPFVLLVYAAGIAAGLAAFHWTLSAAVAMFAIGVTALLFGGPVAKVYGIVMLTLAVLLLGSCRPAH